MKNDNKKIETGTTIKEGIKTLHPLRDLPIFLFGIVRCVPLSASLLNCSYASFIVFPTGRLFTVCFLLPLLTVLLTSPSLCALISCLVGS
jgi:hypothetical protein